MEFNAFTFTCTYTYPTNMYIKFASNLFTSINSHASIKILMSIVLYALNAHLAEYLLLAHMLKWPTVK